MTMIYASGDNIPEVKQKLQNCIKNISSWYNMNRLKINIDKTKVMLIGSKAQLKSLNVDEFILSYDDTPLDLVESARYRYVYKLWYLLGFSCAASLPNYIQLYLIIKKIASYISKESSSTSV